MTKIPAHGVIYLSNPDSKSHTMLSFMLHRVKVNFAVARLERKAGNRQFQLNFEPWISARIQRVSDTTSVRKRKRVKTLENEVIDLEGMLVGFEKIQVCSDGLFERMILELIVEMRHTLYLFVPGKHVKSTPTDDASRLLGYTNNGDDFAYAILSPSNVFTKKSSKLRHILNLHPAFKNELHNH
ncbi:hypothetical protein WN48_06226 [Eufriesea mexicana]|uniref:Uncharacterized protein n=1 Tax=Eufriesea mexicana TaxID=516756 RepID=A0A310S6U2_9HYME|nr:hypothetical protein WN48_06226 [Eufriesea mexicana]